MDTGALLEQLRQDRTAGIETLLRQYGPLMQYVAGGVLRDRQDTEDCCAEVSVLVWQHLEDFDPARGSLTAWLTALTRNTALNHLKARQRRQAHLAEPETEPAHHDTPEEAVLRQERAERLKAVITRMGGQDKQLFYRRYYYLQPIAQIAAEMGMTERAAEGRLYRLRQRLRRELGGDAP